MEARPYLQNIPYFDRLDYVAPINQEHAFCLAIEKLLGRESVTLRAWLLCHRNVHGSVIGPFRQRSRRLPGRKLTTHNLCLDVAAR